MFAAYIAHKSKAHADGAKLVLGRARQFTASVQLRIESELTAFLHRDASKSCTPRLEPVKAYFLLTEDGFAFRPSRDQFPINIASVSNMKMTLSVSFIRSCFAVSLINLVCTAPNAIALQVYCIN